MELIQELSSFNFDQWLFLIIGLGFPLTIVTTWAIFDYQERKEMKNHV